MSRRDSEALRELLFGGASLPPRELLHDPALLRRRFMLAEILAPALGQRQDPRQLCRAEEADRT